MQERKKMELDRLTNQVLEAQHKVEELQAIVTSLTAKSLKFTAALATAETNKQQTLSNKNLLDEVVQNALDLQKNTAIALDEIVNADSKTQLVASEIKVLIGQLIYTAEKINKLASLVVRKKTQNPLISDELVTLVTTCGTDANNAISLTLKALQSTFEAQSANVASNATLALTNQQALELYQTLTGTKADGSKSERTSKCLKELLYDSKTNANAAYELLLKANEEITHQLDTEKINLDRALVNLESLKAGLEAVTGAELSVHEE
jgi:uncharacterized membrane protein YqgA involved in biofilm formation